MRSLFDIDWRYAPASSASALARTLAGTLALAAAVGIPIAATTSAAHAAERKIAVSTQNLAARSDSPLLVLVSLRKQRIRIFDDRGEITSSRISSGQPGFDTPTGVFSILEKHESHESNIYEGAEMPFMQRITWSGIALHAGIVPGYRASHGCIRLPFSFAKSIFSLTKQGNRVVVTNDETRPELIEHSNLFRPLPAEHEDDTAQAAPVAGPAVDAAAKPGDTKVAINTTGSDGTALPNFIGLANAVVPPAAADTPATGAPVAATPEAPAVHAPPRSRAEAEKLLAAKISQLKDDLKAAEAGKAATTEKAKAALRASQDAADNLAAERRAAGSIMTAIDDAEKRLAGARAQFADYMNGNTGNKAAASKPSKRNTEKASTNPEDREADHEDAIIDAIVERDRLRNEATEPLKSVTAAQAALKAAEDAKAIVIAEVRDVQTKLRLAQTALIEANKDAARRNRPLSVFISLKSERVYVRQGFEPVLEAPIAVDKTAGKVGTHVFTAMKFSPKDPDNFEWQHVAAQGAAINSDDNDEGSPGKKKREPNVRRTSGSVRQAVAALNAFEIPDDVLDLIMERARPGASLIVSDRALQGNENGPGTEFTLLTR